MNLGGKTPRWLDWAAGRQVYLWRAIDDEDAFFEVLVAALLDKRAAVRLFVNCYGSIIWRRPPSSQCRRAYAAAIRELKLDADHIRDKQANNLIESSHVPARLRELTQQGFKSAGSAQKSLSRHAATYKHFNVSRHLTTTDMHRLIRADAFANWRLANGPGA